MKTFLVVESDITLTLANILEASAYSNTQFYDDKRDDSQTERVTRVLDSLEVNESATLQFRANVMLTYRRVS